MPTSTCQCVFNAFCLPFFGLMLALSIPVFGTEAVTENSPTGDIRTIPYVSMGSQDQVNAAAFLYQPIRDAEAESKVRSMLMRIYEAWDRLATDVPLRKYKAFPDFVITENKNSFAFTTIASEIGKNGSYTGFLVIPRSALTEKIPEDSILGVLAHEMTHLFRHHRMREGLFENIQHHGQAAPAVTQMVLHRYYFLSQLTDDHNLELDGFPMSGDLLNKLVRMVNGLRDAANRANNPCGENMFGQFEKLGQLIDKTRDPWKSTLTFPPKLAKTLSADVQTFKREVVACAKSVSYSGIDLGIWTTPKESGGQTLFTSVAPALLGRDLNLKSENEFEVLFELTSKVQNEMRVLWNQHKVGELTWSTPEDEADFYALNILHELKLNAMLMAFTVFFVSSPEGTSSEPCVARIRNHQEIPIGPISDPHHSACYRLKQSIAWWQQINPPLAAPAKNSRGSKRK